MNPDELQKNDMILLPRKGTLKSRRVLVISCQQAFLDNKDRTPLADPTTGLPLYDITFLSDKMTVESTILLAKQISLISRYNGEDFND